MLTEEQTIAQAERAEQAFHCLQIAILNIAGSIASGATDALIENLKKVRTFIERDALKNPGWDDGEFHQTLPIRLTPIPTRASVGHGCPGP